MHWSGGMYNTLWKDVHPTRSCTLCTSLCFKQYNALQITVPFVPLQRNTFQAVIATDGSATYVLFLYRDIQWSSGRTTIGFNAGDRVRFFNLPDATLVFDAVFNLDNRTNSGRPGVFMFRVDQDTILQPEGLLLTIAKMFWSSKQHVPEAIGWKCQDRNSNE